MAEKKITKQKTKIPPKQVPGNKKETAPLMKHKEVILLALVVIIAAMIYLPALHHKFTNWDDNDYIMSNLHIKALNAANISYIFTRPVASNYHPITMFSLALNYRVSGIWIACATFFHERLNLLRRWQG